MIIFLIRLDDACPFMDKSKWQQMEDILDKYDIKPLVGIIPDCADSKVMLTSEDPRFWEKVHRWEQKCWSFALHGYNHICISDKGLQGLNPMWKRSEYAGLPLSEQRNKIRYGYEILKKHGINPKFFFAPSHTFDSNTLESLRMETDIRFISDTIGRYPYSDKGFTFFPQISGHFIKFPLSGVYTFCFHPNTMKNDDFKKVDLFIKNNREFFVNFDQVDVESCGKKQIFDKLLSLCFFSYRLIRGLR